MPPSTRSRPTHSRPASPKSQAWKDTDEAHFAIQNTYVFTFLNPGSDY